MLIKPFNAISLNDRQRRGRSDQRANSPNSPPPILTPQMPHPLRFQLLYSVENHTIRSLNEREMLSEKNRPWIVLLGAPARLGELGPPEGRLGEVRQRELFIFIVLGGVDGGVVFVWEMGPDGEEDGGAVSAAGVEDGVEDAELPSGIDRPGHELIGDDAEGAAAGGAEGGEEAVEVGLEGFRGADEGEDKVGRKGVGVFGGGREAVVGGVEGELG